MIEIQKVFNWENYNANLIEHKFEDLSTDELQNWAQNWQFKIKKINKKIYLIGKSGYKIEWK